MIEMMRDTDNRNDRERDNESAAEMRMRKKSQFPAGLGALRTPPPLMAKVMKNFHFFLEVPCVPVKRNISR